jgi:small subunit ribosomal protein S1
LSIKAKDEVEEREVVAAPRDQEPEAAGPKTIGDLIKAQMGN